MVYSEVWSSEVLMIDSYKGYQYCIMSYGHHPCCYVSIHEGHPALVFDDSEYWKIPVSCHGGITFFDKGLRKAVDVDLLGSNEWVIGWDYAHCDDFSGTYIKKNSKTVNHLETRLFGDTKKWSTKALIKECMNVIDQLYLLEHPEVLYA